MSMVLRLYDPASGAVQLDGTDLPKCVALCSRSEFCCGPLLTSVYCRLNLKWLRSQIAVVEQSTTLFPGSIYDNIAIGRDGATRQDVEKAAKMVGQPPPPRSNPA